MGRRSNLKYWMLWGGMSAVIAGLLGMKTFSSDVDRSVMMPGPMTDGHHQIGIACESCHTENFSDKKSMQTACVECHGDQRQKPFDSHPKAKFTDPRNADRLENVDALHCISCHVEHKPEVTDAFGATQPTDFCVHCHAEIAEERPSHEGMPMDTCNSAGCHNYHNNRSLYTDFLTKHLDDTDLLEKRKLPKREFGDVLDQLATYPHDRYPQQTLTAEQADAPAGANTEEALKDWLETSHAAAGVNCSACHVVPTDFGGTGEWTDTPGMSGCAQCHDVEQNHFQQGKHGMRMRVGLSPMTPAMARLPMHSDVADKPLDCLACHGAHDFNVQEAAVESCLTCHNDEHSLAYKQSTHYDLWQLEQSGQAPEGAGVSCASCHMPRVNMDVSEWMSRTVVQHNQNATLSPNEKMMRPACLHCHGLEFSINSLADSELIINNFNGQPSFKTDSMRLVAEEQKRYLERRGKQ